MTKLKHPLLLLPCRCDIKHEHRGEILAVYNYPGIRVAVFRFLVVIHFSCSVIKKALFSGLYQAAGIFISGRLVHTLFLIKRKAPIFLLRKLFFLMMFSRGTCRAVVRNQRKRNNGEQWWTFI